MDSRLDLTFDSAVARLTIRRSDKLNALDAAMVEALLPICRQIERSEAWVVILTGEGKSFCAGGEYCGVVGAVAAGVWDAVVAGGAPVF